jgi:competence protein ComEA
MRSRRSEPDRREVVAHRLSLLAPVPGSSDPARRHGPTGEPGPGAEVPPWWGTHTRVRDHAVVAAAAQRPGSAPAATPRSEPAGESAGESPGDPAEAWPEHVVRPATRVPALTPPPTEPPALVVRVPIPGRHASRRPRVRAGLPTGPLALAPAHLAVLAVAVALALALTSWWVVRSDPVPVAAPATPGPGETAPPLALLEPAGASTGPASTAAEAVVVVDVAGRVRRPGVVELPTGSRVVDALEAAGGVRGAVDLSALNLARVLVDGEQVLVGAPGTAPGPAAGPAPGALPGTAPPGATAPAALVDLNTADQATLESLPEVGPVTAQAILAWRTEHGGFTAVQELLEVDGIGPATLETLAPLVTV